MPDTFPTITENAAELAETLRQISHRKRRRPVEALLLVKNGAISTKLALAERLGVTRGTVDRWMRAYAEHGVEAFVGEKRRRTPGAPEQERPPPGGTPGGGKTPGTLSAPFAAPPESEFIAALDTVRGRLRGLYGLEMPGPEYAVQVYVAYLRAVEARLAVREAEASEPNPALPLEQAQVQPGEDPRPCVLLGESDDLVASIIEARLVREGLRVERATDGIELVTIAEEKAVDLFLVDLRLSGLDGYQIARWIREDERLASAPIILLGWPGKETDVAEAFAAGADDYILKPFSPIDLSARISRLLKSSQRQTESVPSTEVPAPAAAPAATPAPDPATPQTGGGGHAPLEDRPAAQRAAAKNPHDADRVGSDSRQEERSP